MDSVLTKSQATKYIVKISKMLKLVCKVLNPIQTGGGILALHYANMSLILQYKFFVRLTSVDNYFFCITVTLVWLNIPWYQ